ncbi:hypothetical protein HY406_01350 [Candidatus Giovannonibacteria bacterium]|nr:hypothetical protein [Candidatus Giovannonibacteria bacterium]
MTQRILNKTYNAGGHLAAMRQDRLGFILLVLIAMSLVVYIYGLNVAIGEGFQRERLEKELKVLRQDLQARQEFFISKLGQFYEDEAASFAEAEVGKAQFVQRRANVAQARAGFTQ